MLKEQDGSKRVDHPAEKWEVRDLNGSSGRNRYCAIRSSKIDSDRAFQRHGATNVREERTTFPSLTSSQYP